MLYWRWCQLLLQLLPNIRGARLQQHQQEDAGSGHFRVIHGGKRMAGKLLLDDVNAGGFWAPFRKL
jgi:hypothetical protein